VADISKRVSGSNSIPGETMIDELIRSNRSFRRFHQEHRIKRETLVALVDLARHSASAANHQPLKYYLSTEAQTNAVIFDTLGWAWYLQDWGGPAEGERPSAYIVILGDTQVHNSFSCDHGIAAQSMLLGAVERGLGGCVVGSISRGKLRQELALEERFEILLVLALGKPSETVVIDEIGPDGSIKYWRDDQDVHHVPKRSLDEIIITKPQGP
jgi:nitroreductase